MRDLERNAVAGEQIIQLMIDIGQDDECANCEVSAGESTFERLWDIYKTITGDDADLKKLFPGHPKAAR